jgi:hypothetical protein
MILAYAGVGAFVLVSLVIGVRLLLLWRRTRKLPELVIGLSFLCEGVLTNVFNVAEKFSGRLPERCLGPIHIGVVVACVVAMAAYSVDCAFPHDGVYGPRNLWWWWMAILFRAGAHGWMGLEAFLYHRLMRRRLRLGLADPVVADRMWLWSVAGTAIAILWLGAGVARTVGGAAGLQHPLTLQFIAVLGLLSAITNWLVFVPPRAYVRRIERRALQAA